MSILHPVAPRPGSSHLDTFLLNLEPRDSKTREDMGGRERGAGGTDVLITLIWRQHTFHIVLLGYQMRRQTKADGSMRRGNEDFNPIPRQEGSDAGEGTKLKIPSADLVRLCGLWWKKIF